jgi:hypothetical protein
MSMSDAIYYAIMLLVVGFIAWLLLVPAPGHDPLVVFQHASRIA